MTGPRVHRLANGVRVVLKPTDYMNDQVVLSGTSPGGTSLVPDSLHVSATYASTAAEEPALSEGTRCILSCPAWRSRAATLNRSYGS